MTSTIPEQCRNQNKHFKAGRDHGNIQFVILKWVCFLLKAFEQVVCTTRTVLITCKDTKYLIHTYIIFFCVRTTEKFSRSPILCLHVFLETRQEKKKGSKGFITKWRASSGFTQLYNEMILCLITEEERMKCTCVLLHKMLYGWSDMWKQQNLLSSARISRCSYVFEVFSQYFAQWWMFNY